MGVIKPIISNSPHDNHYVSIRLLRSPVFSSSPSGRFDVCLGSSVVLSHAGCVSSAAVLISVLRFVSHLLLVCLTLSTGGLHKPSGSVAPFAAARLMRVNCVLKRCWLFSNESRVSC